MQMSVAAHVYVNGRGGINRRMTDEPMDIEKVVAGINRALPLQLRSALQYTWMAGSATGVEWQAVALRLQEFALRELDDARRLIEKVTALGSQATTDVASFDPVPLSNQGVARLIDNENATLEALREIIPATGEEARSEALEHLLEHIILRKQDQVDFLARTARS